MRFYAVRMGDFVEIRSASRRPKGLVSILTKTVVRLTRQVKYPPYELPLSRPVKSKITLKTVFYNGGKVIGTMKLHHLELWDLAPQFKEKYEIQEISSQLKTLLLPHLSR